MQSNDSQSGMFDGTKVAKALRTSVQPIWNKMYLKVSYAGKQIKRFFDGLCTTDFHRKVLQAAVDYLSSHPSADFAIRTTVVFAAIFIVCGVALECLYFLRLVYWMVVNIFISALNLGAGKVFVVICFFCHCLCATLNFLMMFSIRLTTGIFWLVCYSIAILWAVLKFLVYWLSGALLIHLVCFWALNERKRLSISKRSDTKQKPGTSTGKDVYGFVC